MSTKSSRAGGKFTGKHTSVIPAAATVADLAEKIPAVKKITLGIIRSGLRPLTGPKRVKCTPQTHCVLASVRDNTSVQEFRCYGDNAEAIANTLERRAGEAGFSVTT